MRTILRAVPAALAVLLLAACATGPTAHPTGHTAPAVSADAVPGPATTTGAGGYTDVSLPIYAYAVSDAQLSEIVNAQKVLVQRCMRSYGFASYTVKAGAYHPTPDRRYGIIDPAYAERYGYSWPTSFRTLVAHEPAAPPPALTGAEAAVLNGPAAAKGQAADEYDGKAVPSGGCLGQSERTIAPQGDFGAVPAAATIKQDSFDLLSHDSRAVAATSAWAACMRGRGYRYATPFAAAAVYDPMSAPTAASIALAEADVACKGSSRLVSVWQGVEAAYEIQHMDAGRAQLSAQKAAFDRQLAVAAAILPPASAG